MKQNTYQKLNKRKTLTEEEISNIKKDYKELRKIGNGKTYSYISLSEKYNLSYSTVYYWIDDKYREKHKNMSKFYYKETKNKLDSYNKWLQQKEKELYLTQKYV